MILSHCVLYFIDDTPKCIDVQIDESCRYSIHGLWPKTKVKKRPPPSPQGSPFGLLDYKVAIIKHHLYTFTYNKYYDGNVENQ